MSNNVIAFPAMSNPNIVLKEPDQETEKAMDEIEEVHRGVVVTHLIAESVARKILVDMETNEIDWENEKFLQYHGIIIDLLTAAIYGQIGQEHPYLLFLKTINESLKDGLGESE